jgi:hypothetical protein
MKRLFTILFVLIICSCEKEPIIYTLTTSVNPVDGGTLSPSTQQYDEGKLVTLNATPSTEFIFQSWSGANGSSNTTSVVMNSDKSVIANFIKKQYPLTFDVEGEGTVTEKVIKEGIATDYISGTIVEINAVPSTDWLFVEWKGDLNGNENPTQITIDNPKNITAVFVDTKSNEIIEFSLLKENNPLLIEDLTFEINNDTIYKYVPYFINAEKIISTFKHNGKSVKVNDTLQISSSSINNFNLILDYSVEALNGNTKNYAVILESFTKLPVVLIDIENKSDITSKEDYLEGQLTFIGKNYKNPYFKKEIKIRGRGHFTWQQPKKPYQLKFKDKTSFFDMPSDKKWIFLANFIDKTMARTRLAFELGYISNLDWTARSQFAEVILNDEYIGTYQVSEKVEEDDHRVNIGNNGYLLEVDQLDKMKSDDIYFNTPRNIYFNVKSPEIISNSEEFNYIKNYITKIENILYAQNYDGEKLRTLIDIDSFVEFFLINEISKNNDAAFWSSTYMTLVPGEKLKMGPIWDFDVAFGNININENWLSSGWHMKKNSHWIKMLFRDDLFIQKVKQRFNYFYNNKNRILNLSDELSKKLHKSRLENEKVWKTLGYYYFPQYAYDFSSFEEEHEYLNNWINERYEWLKNAIDEL